MRFRALSCVDLDTPECSGTSMCIRKKITMPGCKKDGSRGEVTSLVQAKGGQ